MGTSLVAESNLSIFSSIERLCETEQLRKLAVSLHRRYIAVIDSECEDLTMAILTVRNVPDEVHRALRVRAAMHGRSTEAEVRDILESVVKPEQRIRMGDALAELGRRQGLTNDDFAVFDQVRDDAPAEPMRFE